LYTKNKIGDKTINHAWEK